MTGRNNTDDHLQHQITIILNLTIRAPGTQNFLLTFWVPADT